MYNKMVFDFVMLGSFCYTGKNLEISVFVKNLVFVMVFVMVLLYLIFLFCHFYAYIDRVDNGLDTVFIDWFTVQGYKSVMI